jgi:hypothetical protein
VKENQFGAGERRPAETSYFAGVDLGQRKDYTAIAVVERAVWLEDLDYVTYERPRRTELRLRHLERLPLGTSYLEIAERVKEVANAPMMAGRCTVVADATGVGGPVIDLLRRGQTGYRLAPVTITGGERESYERGYYRVPKRNLIVGLQVMLEQKRLQVASRMAEAATLMKELREMQVKVTAAGRETYGVWREGAHDDLALAVALACWWSQWTGRQSMAGTRPLV